MSRKESGEENGVYGKYYRPGQEDKAGKAAAGPCGSAAGPGWDQLPGHSVGQPEALKSSEKNTIPEG